MIKEERREEWEGVATERERETGGVRVAFPLGSGKFSVFPLYISGLRASQRSQLRWDTLGYAGKSCTYSAERLELPLVVQNATSCVLGSVRFGALSPGVAV